LVLYALDRVFAGILPRELASVLHLGLHFRAHVPATAAASPAEARMLLAVAPGLRLLFASRLLLRALRLLRAPWLLPGTMRLLLVPGLLLSRLLFAARRLRRGARLEPGNHPLLYLAVYQPLDGGERFLQNVAAVRRCSAHVYVSDEGRLAMPDERTRRARYRRWTPRTCEELAAGRSVGATVGGITAAPEARGRLRRGGGEEGAERANCGGESHPRPLVRIGYQSAHDLVEPLFRSPEPGLHDRAGRRTSGKWSASETDQDLREQENDDPAPVRNVPRHLPRQSWGAGWQQARWQSRGCRRIG
jgi:hypothetical protein